MQSTHTRAQNGQNGARTCNKDTNDCAHVWRGVR